MGIDAEMLVKISRKENWLTEEQVDRLSYELASSVGAKYFMILWSDDDFSGGGRHALSIMEPVSDSTADDYGVPELAGKVVWFQDGDPVVADSDEQFIKVNLYDRYYGEGYERGSWPILKAIAEWLQVQIPNGSVHYGGDSSGVCLEPLDATAIARLTRHWIFNGRRPYVHYSWRDDTVDCPHCKAPMANCGGARDYSFLWCDGCDRKASKHVDGRLVWAKRFHDYPTLNEQGEFEQRKDTFR